MKLRLFPPQLENYLPFNCGYIRTLALSM